VLMRTIATLPSAYLSLSLSLSQRGESMNFNRISEAVATKRDGARLTWWCGTGMGGRGG
jgi:hypothetical protein